MANTIELAKKYAPLLDEKYRVESKTSILDIDANLVREGATARSILIPKVTLQGLADYNRNNGFTKGDVSLEWVEYTFTQDRARTFSVDAMDNLETVGVAFGRLANDFIQLCVAPEIDMYRFSTYANKAKNSKDGSITADNVIAAIDTAQATLNDEEVPEDGRVLFVSNAVYNLMKHASDLNMRFDVQSGNGVVDRRIEYFDNMPIVKVPKGRFYTEYDFYDGTTDGQEDGGAVPAATAKEINFMIIHKSSVSQVVKTATPRIFDPMTNQNAHAYKFDYRLYHDAWVLDNKTAGIYLHKKA